MTPQSFPFSKNRYFPHKRMRSSDFIREQAYVEQKLAFLSRWDFGAGVAAGPPRGPRCSSPGPTPAW